MENETGRDKTEDEVEDTERSCKTQEVPIIATHSGERRTTSTQTSMSAFTAEEVKNLEINESKNVSHSSPSFCMEQKSSTYWSVEDDPVPQWLLEEALGRGNEVCKESWWKKREEETANREREYEIIISELEEKLKNTRAEIKKAIKKKCIVKEKYKRMLQVTKVEASKESKILQEKIIQICTAVLEKFGPYALLGTKLHKPRFKNCTRVQHSKWSKKFSNKLHNKLRIKTVTVNKLKRQLAETRRTLKEKSEKYDLVNKCFTRLKQEMETTEINLNNLITENVTLRKKFEDMQEWMDLKMEKGHYERNNTIQLRDMQKNKELSNLKKKAEEDFTTITQLRNKLLRSESANANKGFLLNSYKSQLSDLGKDKEQLIAKIKGLENNINTFRNSNAQLKAKISLINEEKEQLISGSEKSEMDLKQRMETQFNQKYKESTQLEINAVKSKCEETIKAMKIKMITFENRNTEYFIAIKEFLKKIQQYYGEQEVEKSLSGSEASEKEACDTACSILNMTPEQLSGFMNGRAPSTISSWLSDLSEITSKNKFANGLAKFLFKKTIENIKT